MIRIFEAGYWRKGKKLYDQKRTYSDEDLGDVKFITDFLLSPAELQERNENTKIENKNPKLNN